MAPWNNSAARCAELAHRSGGIKKTFTLSGFGANVGPSGKSAKANKTKQGAGRCHKQEGQVTRTKAPTRRLLSPEDRAKGLIYTQSAAELSFNHFGVVPLPQGLPAAEQTVSLILS